MHKKNINTGNLYIISTPIGNIKDITYRSIETLKNVDIIAAENINHTKKLLNFYKIKNKIISFNKNNEKKKNEKILKILLNKKHVGIVSNAGTPLINDPGYLIVKKCHKKNIKVTPIPGPCAAIAAISSSGIQTKKFCYEGFVPKKKKKIKKMLEKLYLEDRTIIIYETSNRIIKTLKIMSKIFGKNKKITFAKEITKIWETIKKTKLKKLIKWLKSKKSRTKGEIILIIDRNKKLKKKKIYKKILKTFKIVKNFLPTSTAIKITSKIHDLNKNILYKYILKK
ncbi:16S rRNA (cytidine(1402)-2'-O)-methyltransferase [Buchnera aphidicola (Astegopteryx bambusae)]|uniref:16S rRNA (cytidine(1402)-2'-O)-methyltransferase n=2 Tax=Buchnera aphidicola TaxID=9 RepID=UPI0031B89563